MQSGAHHSATSASTGTTAVRRGARARPQSHGWFVTIALQGSAAPAGDAFLKFRTAGFGALRSSEAETCVCDLAINKACLFNQSSFF